MPTGQQGSNGTLASSVRLWPLLVALRGAIKRIFHSTSMRLLTVVLAAGLVALTMIGSLTIFRLDSALKEQAKALEQLSESQLAHRLDGEAQLARARLEALEAQTAQQLRQLAQRADIGKAVASRNDITIADLLASVAKTSTFDALIAFDEEGRVIGASTAKDLLALNVKVRDSALAFNLRQILSKNSRQNPQGHHGIRELEAEFLTALEMPVRLTIVHETLEPVFNDFGELIGALGAIRALAKSERTLEQFSSLSNSGVVIMQGREIVSAAGPPGVTFSHSESNASGLLLSDDNTHLARCVDYAISMKVCVFADSSVVTAGRDQMFGVGADQTRTLVGQLLFSAALILVMLVIALFIGIRHSTRGLSTLARAAEAVAGGNVDVPFTATGVGEVFSLGLAFERMLENLRANIGKIRQLAFFDGVTQLPNREKNQIDAPALIERFRSGALLFIDLDGFKLINDTFGHKVGDCLLQEVANRLGELLVLPKSGGDSGDVAIARVGGDEFVVMLPSMSREAVSSIARKLIEGLQSPFEVSGLRMGIGASIGITLFPNDGSSYDGLLINADLAMYAAKKRGRNTFAFFTPEIAEQARERVVLENDLKEVVRAHQLAVKYQPKVSCRDGRICGVEALVRWNHPTKGNIPPDKFIAIAEETGLIADIDRFVLERATREIGELIKTGSDIVLAVNVSVVEMEDPCFSEDVIKILNQTGFPPSRLELEITETAAMRDPAVVGRRIASLRLIGIRFAIDDFGAGYSNLAALARLPFDAIKLDRSLIQDVRTDPEKQSIIRIALGLAQALGFETVAEGVETMEDFEFVAQEGATMAQGFLFSPALSLDELTAMLQPQRLAEMARHPYGSSKAPLPWTTAKKLRA